MSEPWCRRGFLPRASDLSGSDEGSHLRGVFFAWRNFHATGDVHAVRLGGANGSGNVLRRQAAGQNQGETEQSIAFRRHRVPIDNFTGAAKRSGIVSIEQDRVRQTARLLTGAQIACFLLQVRLTTAKGANQPQVRQSLGQLSEQLWRLVAMQLPGVQWNRTSDLLHFGQRSVYSHADQFHLWKLSSHGSR